MTGSEPGVGAGRGRLRAAHADREQVIEVLKAAFVQGRLDKDEFDARVGQVLASRTYAELVGLTADLPASPPAARPAAARPGRPARPARGQAPQPVARPAPVILATSVLYASLWALALFGPDVIAGPSAAALALFTAFIVVTVIGIPIAMIASRQAKRRSGQLPPQPTAGPGGQAARRLPSAGPPGQHPPIERGRRHTAEAARCRRGRPAIAPAR